MLNNLRITDMIMVDENIFTIKAIGERDGHSVVLEIPKFFIDINSISIDYENAFSRFGAKPMLKCAIETQVLAKDGNYCSMTFID